MKIEIGDVMICLPGFTNNISNSNYGGAGYTENKIFTVGSITGNGRVIWANDESGKGVYSYTLKHYTNRKSRIEKLHNENL